MFAFRGFIHPFSFKMYDFRQLIIVKYVAIGICRDEKIIQDTKEVGCKQTS